MKLFENSFNFNRRIQKYRKYCLSSTSIINYLSRKEEIFIIHGERFLRILVFCPFEEEDESINLGFDLGDQLIVFHTVNFFNLSGRHPQAVDKFGENTRIRLNGTPLVEHIKKFLIFYNIFDYYMKGSKVSSSFITNFSSYLSKFKETSTISIAHDQIRKLFSQYKYSDVAISFLSKMDSCDQLNDKEKKEHSKVYITLIDVYGQDIVLQHYQRLIQSIVKKPIGVSDVVGHLCKTLLNRIYPVENISNYIKHLLIMFKQHSEAPKIIKQIMESFDGQLTQEFQIEMITIIAEKMNNNKSKVQHLQGILAVILALENRFSSENIIQNLVLKNFKNQDWNTRKLCIDISHALLVIKKQANASFHQCIKQIKYDKIKHVRQAASNYFNLHKQVYGEQQKKSQIPTVERKTTSKIGISKSPNFRKTIAPEMQTNVRSLEKKKKGRNQGFFQNAKNKDILKTPEQNKSLHVKKQRIPINFSSNSKSWQHEIPTNPANEKTQQKEQQNMNFENYLKTREPKSQFFGVFPTNERESNDSGEKESPIEIPLKQFDNGENTFRKRKQQQSQIQFQSNLADSSLFMIEEANQNIKTQLASLKEMFMNFEHRILEKITSIDDRVNMLQKRISEDSIKSKKSSYIQDEKKFKSKASDSEASLQSQSNLQQKIKESIIKNNWDQAFALVLANNKRAILMQLLTHCRIPSDKLVVDCLFMEVKKQLKSCISLKWLLVLIQETQISNDKLKKLKKDLQKTTKNLSEDSESRNYLMLRNMLLNELEEKIN